MEETGKTIAAHLYEARSAVERAALAYIHEPYPQREVSKLLIMLDTLDEMQKFRNLALEVAVGRPGGE